MAPHSTVEQTHSAKHSSTDDVNINKEDAFKTSEVEAQYTELDPKMDARLRKKIDLFIIPVFGILYLLCFLDRGNIGNANVATPSISQSLGLSPVQFGACVSVFYATYVISEPLWSILTKIVTPKLLLTASTIVWGGLTLGTAWSKEYGHLVAIRVLLGWFEGGLFPCLAVYLFMNFRREEIARRISYIYLCSGISGAVGGLIATGLIRIETGSIVGWQYLYIVEGVISLAAAPLVWFTIPNKLQDAWFLNAEEKTGAIARAKVLSALNNHDDEFSWRQIRAGFLDWKAYTSGITQFAACFTLYGVSTFMPAIIRGMGYSNVNAQLLTVPVYLFAALVYLVLARLSERYACRGPFLLGGFAIVLVGYIILATVKNEAVRYFGLFLMASGLYSNPGLNISWVSGNTAGHYKRSTTFGLNQLMGNSAGASIGSIFLSSLAPRYTRSLWIGFGITVAGFLAILFNMMVYKTMNRRREKACAEGAQDQPHLGDLNPHFRYFM